MLNKNIIFLSITILLYCATKSTQEYTKKELIELMEGESIDLFYRTDDVVPKSVFLRLVGSSKIVLLYEILLIDWLDHKEDLYNDLLECVHTNDINCSKAVFTVQNDPKVQESISNLQMELSKEYEKISKEYELNVSKAEWLAKHNENVEKKIYSDIELAIKRLIIYIILYKKQSQTNNT